MYCCVLLLRIATDTVETNTVKKLRAYGVTTDNQFLELDKLKPVRHCQRFQDFLHNSPGILDIPWFMDEAWFHLFQSHLSWRISSVTIIISERITIRTLYTRL